MNADAALDAKSDGPTSPVDAGADVTSPRDAAADSSSCTNQCTLGATTCQAGGLSKCVLGANGCTSYAAPTACPARQTCAVGASSCSCSAEPLCPATGTACADTTRTATCATDVNGCRYVVSYATCSTAVPNATPRCASGSCGYTCQSTYSACGPACVNLKGDGANCGTCGNSCNGATCSAGVCQKAAIVANLTGGAGPANLAVGSTLLFYSDSNGALWKVAKHAGSTPVQMTTLPGYSSLQAALARVVAVGDTVYYSAQGNLRIYAMAPTDSVPRTVFDAGHNGDWALHAGKLYWSKKDPCAMGSDNCEHSIKRGSLDGTNEVLLMTTFGDMDPWKVFVNDSQLIVNQRWKSPSTGVTSYRLWRYNFATSTGSSWSSGDRMLLGIDASAAWVMTSGTPGRLWFNTSSTDTVPITSLRAVTSDATNSYFAEPTKVWKLATTAPLDTMTSILTGASLVTGIGVDDKNLYVADGNTGTIWMTPK